MERKFTRKDVIKLGRALNVAKMKVLFEFGFCTKEIADIMNISEVIVARELSTAIKIELNCIHGSNEKYYKELDDYLNIDTHGDSRISIPKSEADARTFKAIKDNISIGKHYESADKMVSHPSHYQSKNGLEVIDAIKAFTEGLEGIEATDTGNIIKYACRWKKKNGIQDLEKIMWYTQHLINHLKEKEDTDNGTKN